jgi:hypothetical protein
MHINQRRNVASYEFSQALVDAGLIPEDMIPRIADMGIVVHSGNIVTLEISLLLDDRIYDIINPKKLKLPEPGVDVQDA